MTEKVPGYLLQVFAKWSAVRCGPQRDALVQCYGEDDGRRGPWACETAARALYDCDAAAIADLRGACPEPLHEWTECYRKRGDWTRCSDARARVSACTQERFGVPVDNWEERYYAKRYPLN